MWSTVNKGATWKWRHCYELLKDEPKFTTHVMELDKAQRSKKGESFNAMDLADGTQTPIDHTAPEPPERALGKKAEERRRQLEREALQSSHSESNASFKEISSNYALNTETRNLESTRRHEREMAKIAVEEKRLNIKQDVELKRLDLKRK